MDWAKNKDLNALFVAVVHELGQPVEPIPILRGMKQICKGGQVGRLTGEKVGHLTKEKVRSLTREQVASHLQKHWKKKELHLPEQQHIRQQQIQHEHHEHHPPCQTMYNSGDTSLFGGNGVNNFPMRQHIAPNPIDISPEPFESITSADWELLRCTVQQPDESPFSVSGMQQLDQNPSSDHSGIINQNRALSTSFERNNMEQQPDQTSYALYAPIRSDHDGMMTQEATHLDEFFNHGAGLFNQHLISGMQQLDHALSTSFERNNMEQQPDQTSYDLYAPIRSGNDGMMMTPEATHVDELDEFVASLFNPECEFGLDVQSSDVDNFPK
ncbi:hypothetical protein K1719_028139 [Acacia pycnantha]|nr:hypothetical protein K1719_028139 [Acacia pycnantha]